MVWKLQDVKTNSQNWAQDEINLHKKERNKLNLNQRTWLMKIGIKNGAQMKSWKTLTQYIHHGLNLGKVIGIYAM